MSLFHAAALLVTALGVSVFALGALARAFKPSLALSLELWTAAGLLGLSGQPSARAIAGAAVILAVRRVIIRATTRATTSARWASRAASPRAAGAGRG